MRKHFWLGMMLLCGGVVFGESLPKIYLSYDKLDRDTFNNGTFTLVNGEDTLNLCMKVRHRGAYAARFEKAAYAIKLLDEKGKKYETSLLGMRKDNYWVLDAMAIDKARMRNRVAMDIWLAMSHDPWYKAQEKKVINGYRGQIVEVFLDSMPRGIYCLMERIDRKQLKLPKYVDSLGVQSTLYKSIRAERSGFEKRPSYCPSSKVTVWDYQWEPKHPDYEDGEPIDWRPLYNMFHFIWDADSTTFVDSIASYVDLPVWRDYELFCQFIAAWDNTSKNMYVSFYDTQNDHRGLVSPWDIDHSFGRKWDSSEESDSIILFDKNKLSIRLRKEYPGYQDSLNQRWKELRQTIFSEQYVDSVLDYYFDLYQTTGMDTLEQRLWSGVGTVPVVFDIPSERFYIKDWLQRRVAFLDSCYHYEKPDVPTEQQSTIEKIIHQKILLDGHMYILKSEHVYDCLGRRYK